MDTQNLQLFATVGAPTHAGWANAAVDVGLERTPVSHFDTQFVVRSLDYLDTQLVPEHTRVLEEGLASGEGVEVGPANADAPDAHKRFSLGGSRRRQGALVKGTGLL